MMTTFSKLFWTMEDLLWTSYDVKCSKDLWVGSVIISTPELHRRERKHAQWIATCLRRSGTYV